MFSVPRFDATRGSGAAYSNAGPSSAASGGQNGSLKPLRPPVDRIALLNAKRAAQQGQGTAVASTASAAESRPAERAAASFIHPARLAQSQVLRHADRKIRSSLQPGNKEPKTKAKQRYLSRKKERRRNREKTKKILDKAAEARAAGVKPEQHVHGVAPLTRKRDIVSTSPDGSSSGSDSSGSDREGIKAHPRKRPRSQASSSSPSSAATASSPTDEEELQVPRTAEDVERAEKAAAAAAEAAADAALAREERSDGLERFPAPRATRLASKKDLAAQGLPEGLAEPHFVRSTISATVKKSDTRALDSIGKATKARLDELGVSEWFAVQTAVIPLLLGKPQSFSLYPSPPLGDVCVSAPTGSGKTLSYAVPIIEVLGKRIHRRTRALILVPTRDLVQQVRETLGSVSKGTPLSIASISGSQSFSHEQAQLVDMRSVPVRSNVAGIKPLARGSEEEVEVLATQRAVMRGPWPGSASKAEKAPSANADIVIATPGRLIDHLDQTPGFTLQHLRFLVIDEADRLLSQSFQEWLPRILDAIDPQKGVEALVNAGEEDSFEALAPAWLAQKRIALADRGGGALTPREKVTALLPPRHSSVQKLLFSATLTRDPARIVALGLREAAFISVEGEERPPKSKHPADEEQKIKTGHASGEVTQEGDGEANLRDWQESFPLPASLSEHMVVLSAEEKPLHLLHLLCRREAPLRHVLCFTKSLESAARLVHLLDFFKDVQGTANSFVVKEYSSEQPAAERSRLLGAFKRQVVDILICSDVMARGIDLPSVDHVISYDAPIHLASYVHRVGRTARAGRAGNAWTLVERSEARHFTHMMRRAGGWERIHKERRARPQPARSNGVQGQAEGEPADAPDPRYAGLLEDYKIALQRLEKLYSRKRRA